MEHDFQIRTEAVDGKLSVTGQLRAEDMERLAQAGYRSVINNRPDAEGGPEQPTSHDLKQAAEAAGLHYRHLPVAPAGHTAPQGREMVHLVQQLPAPVVAFCRTGRRSAALYTLGKNTSNEA